MQPFGGHFGDKVLVVIVDVCGVCVVDVVVVVVEVVVMEIVKGFMGGGVVVVTVIGSTVFVSGKVNGGGLFGVVGTKG